MIRFGVRTYPYFIGWGQHFHKHTKCMLGRGVNLWWFLYTYQKLTFLGLSYHLSQTDFCKKIISVCNTKFCTGTPRIPGFRSKNVGLHILGGGGLGNRRSIKKCIFVHLGKYWQLWTGSNLITKSYMVIMACLEDGGELELSYMVIVACLKDGEEMHDHCPAPSLILLGHTHPSSKIHK